MKSYRAISLLAGGALMCAISGCASSTQQEAAQQPPAPQVAERTPDVKTHMAFPTGVDSTSVIAIERVVPPEAVAGQPFEYNMLVTNLTNMPLTSVIVRDMVTGNFKVNNTSPPVMAGGKSGDLVWNLEGLRPHEIREIRVNVTPAGTGPISSCANVSYESVLCQTTNVVQPALDLVMSMPKEAGLCDPVPVNVSVTNKGTGAARNVHVRPTLPLGFTTTDGKTDIDLNAGTLAAGKTQEFALSLKAPKAGEYRTKFAAAGDGGLTAETASNAIVIRQPVLKISEKGREKQYTGRAVGFDIIVTNTGDWPALDTMLQTDVPADAAFASATAGGVLTAKKDLVNWSLGTIEPKASRTVSVNFTSSQLGLLRCEAAASAVCAAPVMTYAQTEIAGIPAVLLEMSDNPDPVEVGQNTVYTITVTNQGSATDTNIRLLCTLESHQSMEFVSASGATTVTAGGDTITFAPLAKLAPQAQAEWKVIIKAIKEHDSRFKVEMITDQLQEGGVVKTESTHFYK